MTEQATTTEEQLKVDYYWFQEAANHTSCDETKELLEKRAKQMKERFPDIEKEPVVEPVVGSKGDDKLSQYIFITEDRTVYNYEEILNKYISSEEIRRGIRKGLISIFKSEEAHWTLIDNLTKISAKMFSQLASVQITGTSGNLQELYNNISKFQQMLAGSK